MLEVRNQGRGLEYQAETLELGEPRAVDRPAVGPLEGRMQELADRCVAGRRVFWRAHLP